MAKELFLVRHAKSSWANPQQRDFDRPLNERGLRDAPTMAERLWKLNKRPALWVSSPAVRAAATARAFATVFQMPEQKIEWDADLYLPEPDYFEVLLRKTPDEVDSMVVFSHNPGITLFANRFQGIHLDNIPTSGMFSVQLLTDSWRSFRYDQVSFQFFDFPKNLSGEQFRSK